MVTTPTLAEIEVARRRLGDRVIETPVHRWRGDEIAMRMGADTDVYLKLELLQYTGTFKPRGALTVMLGLTDEQRGRGVTAVSAGNHAIAVAYAARMLGCNAKVVMPKSANPFRQARCRHYGAEIVLAGDIAEAFAIVQDIEAQEGRVFVHPFEGPLTALGTATVGLEFGRQADALDAVIVPVGGGGLCAGVATAIKLLQPHCQVFGVEPEGAATMQRSFASGKPESVERVETIADSLGAPYAMPYSYALCRAHTDEIVLVSDDELRAAMALMFADLKLAVEPAGAAAAAALVGPLRQRLRGRRVGLVVSGTNIDIDGYADHVRRGMTFLPMGD